MRIPESCAKCLYDRQKNRCADEEYLKEVRRIIDQRSEDDVSPLLVYRFDQAYARRFGEGDGYAAVKRRYNDKMLELEPRFRERIEKSADPAKTALLYARVGNYIDYGAMDTVDEGTFFGLFEGAALRESEEEIYDHLMRDCGAGKSFLLIADNCGEIVLDKMFLEQLKKRFPRLDLQVMVRGGEVLNDVTAADAAYTGMDRIAKILTNGAAVAGTVYTMLPEESRAALDGADVVLAKGQGNYESLSGQGRHIYYSFLCKCDLFMKRFNVPKLTGMLAEQGRAARLIDSEMRFAREIASQ